MPMRITKKGLLMTDLMKWIVPIAVVAAAVAALPDTCGWAVLPPTQQQASSTLQLALPESFGAPQVLKKNFALASYYPLKYEEYLIRSLQKQNRVQQEKIDFLTSEVAAANYRLLAAKIDLFSRRPASVSSKKKPYEGAVEAQASPVPSEDTAYEDAVQPSIASAAGSDIEPMESMKQHNEVAADSAVTEGCFEGCTESGGKAKAVAAAAAAPIEPKEVRSSQKMVEQVSRALALVDEAEASQRQIRRVLHEQNAIFEVMEKRLAARKAVVEQKLQAAKSHKPAGESMPHVAASSVSEGGKGKRDSVIAYIQEELNVLTALQADLEGMRSRLDALEP